MPTPPTKTVPVPAAQKPTPQEANRVLTHLGYAVKKESLTPALLQEIRTELTVVPRTGGGKFAGAAAAKTSPFTVFLESPTRLYLPRVWARAKGGLGNAEVSILQDGIPLRRELKFVGKPYDYQTEIIEKCFTGGVEGLLCVPCGRGKTFMAIAIAYRLGRRFMIVVDKEFLLQQWSGELKALLPGIRIGILQGPLAQTEADSYDCTICMLQTLVQRDFPQTVFPTFGLTIFDECHHLGAAHFSRALLKCQTKHMIGLSATPTRDDGLTKVFEWFLGKPFYWERVRKADPGVIVERLDYASDDVEYTKEPTDYRGEIITARLLTQIVEWEPRNRVILKRLLELAEDPRRKILVLSERIGHLRWFETAIGGAKTVAYYIGGMKEGPREEGARTAQILLASYQMASEAMNIKALNAVVMASPRKKIEQSTGRILRTRVEDREVAPLIVDVVDSHDCYRRRWSKRKAYYVKCGYTMNGDTGGDDEEVDDGEDVGDGESDDEEEGGEEKEKVKAPQKKKKKEEVQCLIMDD